MAKYSFEMKMEMVKAYLNGEGGYTYLAKKYGIPDMKPVQCWVAVYKAFGAEGLMRSRKNEAYTFESVSYTHLRRRRWGNYGAGPR